MYALPYHAGSFAALVAANVLHLVPDVAAALAAFRFMLRPEASSFHRFAHDETRLARSTSRLIALTGFPAHRWFSSPSLRAELEAAGIGAAPCPGPQQSP